VQNNIRQILEIAYCALMTKNSLPPHCLYPGAASHTSNCTCITFCCICCCFLFSSRIINWQANQWLSGAEIRARWPSDPSALLCQSLGSRVSNMPSLY